MKKKGFTLIELLVVIAIIAMLLAILMPALNKVKKLAMRVVCGTNTKGIGSAMMVYANDYEDSYPVHGQGGPHTWSEQTTGWGVAVVDWSTTKNITIGSSLYLLVRETDTSPKSFVCPASSQHTFDGKNLNNLDLVALWDFGAINDSNGPKNCVSYAYHMPYNGDASTGSPGRFSADGNRSAQFAILADKNPWYDTSLTVGGATGDNYVDRVRILGDDWTNTNASLQSWELDVANSKPHDREGQNVMYADGHASFEKRSDVGIRYDNIYTVQNPTTVTGIRRGVQIPGLNDASAKPNNTSDSFLVNDDFRTSSTQ